ncbi:MAG: Calx-beta domain-containing protein, partial [Anaerolineae bacterium]
VLLTLTATDNTRVTVDAANDTASLVITDDDLATVSVAVGQDAEEPDINGWFVIAFSNPVTQSVTVSYTVGGTASAGDDYQALPGSVVVAASTLSVTVPVTVVDDVLIEGSEMVELTLAETDNSRVSAGTVNPAALTIADDDTSRVTVLVGQNAAEPDINGWLVITMTKPATTSVTISYTVSGTASAGVDYAALSGAVVIPTDTLSVTVAVEVQDDILVEEDETVVVTLTESDNIFAEIYTPDTATLLIEDNDTTEVSITPLDNAAEPDVDGHFVVSLTQEVATSVVVSYTTGGSATAGTDYTSLTGTVTIPAGELSATIVVDVLDDTVYEGDETVQVTLDATSHSRVGVSAAGNTATLTIVDNDRPTVAFSHSDYTVAEAAGSALITVTLTGETNLTTTVQYTTTEATATPGSDYIAVSDVLTFAPGITQLTFTVPILTDDLFEDDETVGLLLVDPVNADLGSTNPATLTIIDDSSSIAVIAGTVFEDINANGVQDDGEVGIAGVTITLDGTITATTDVDGDYSFSTLTPGVHTVVETDLEGYFSTTPNEVHVAVTLGSMYPVNFGDAPDDVVEFATIYGTVFEDANGNGVWDTEELGISDVTITLDGTHTTSTGPYGSYTFSTTVAGWHTVVETDPEGYFSTTPNEVHVSVAMDTDYQVDFGDARGDISDFASIYGFVFDDANGNGVMDDTEGGIADVTVTLDQNVVTTTDNLGRYTFSTQVTGVHSIVETDPVGYFSTTPNTVTLDVRSLQADYQVDFGDAREDVADFASLYGTVFEDVNSNGVWDWQNGEVGIGGVAVTLDGTTMTTTDHLGRYTLSTQVVGSHTVVETDPEGYISTTPNTVTVSVTLGNGYLVNFGDVLAPYCLCDPDAFEDDDMMGQAKTLTEAGRQAHNFCDDATDWMVFTVEAGSVYTITTSSWGRRADTVVALFDPDGHTLIAENDDYEGATDFSSRIVWEAPATGDYFVRITNRAGLSGCLTDYEVWVERQSFDISMIYLPLVLRAYATALPLNTSQEIPLTPMGVISHTCADAYEVDDTWEQARPIVEGLSQTHSFDSNPALYAVDKDFVTFDIDSGRTVTFTVTPFTDTMTLLMDTLTLLELYDTNGMALAVTGTGQLVWEASASGTYYLSASPLMNVFGCVDETGYKLRMQTSASSSKIFLPLVMRNFAP